jgi:hypothetical protein
MSDKNEIRQTPLSIVDRGRNLFYELLSAFGMSNKMRENEIRQAGLIVIDRGHNLFLAHMKKERKDAVRDSNLSPKWVESMDRVIRLNGLHPSAVDLVLKDNVLYNPALAWNITFTPVDDFDFKAPIIGLSTQGNRSLKYNAQDPFLLKAMHYVAEHEFTHTLKWHAPIYAYTTAMLAVLHNKKSWEIEDVLEKSPAFYRLRLAQEKEADTYHAIKYAESAECAMANVNIADWCSGLYKGSYPLIAIAYTNWKFA